MKKSVMKKWVKALRSGKYKQGRWRLKKGDSYCCLGVLCKESKLVSSKSMSEGMYLPDVVLDYAGMRYATGTFLTPNSKIVRSLVDLNDNRGYSFKKIADYIEKYWEQL